MTRSGFARLDLAATVAILGFFAMLALPVVQQAREAAARQQCTDNLRHLGLAFHDYEKTHGSLPPRGYSTPRSGWMTFLLPHLGQGKVAEQYHWDEPWSGRNNIALAAVRIPTFECPSHPGPREAKGSQDGVEFDFRGVDYAANGGLAGNLATLGWLPEGHVRNGVFMRDRALKLCDVIDGTPTTVAVVECSGRPSRWNAGKEAGQLNVSRMGVWTDNNHVEARGHTADGVVWPGTCAINCSNYDGIYSFHPGGANLLMVDGSVRFHSEKMTHTLLYALYTPAGGEVISLDDM